MVHSEEYLEVNSDSSSYYTAVSDSDYEFQDDRPRMWDYPLPSRPFDFNTLYGH